MKKKTEFEKAFTFPFELHGYQGESSEELQGRECSLLKYKVGLGKTAVSTHTALNLSLTGGVEQIIILCPPILIDQWEEWLLSIGGIPDVLVYRGDPRERALMDLDTAVVICSYNIFRGTKKLTADHKRFLKLSKTRKLCIIADELSLKDLKSQTYRKLKMMVYGKMRVKEGDKPLHNLIALNATPLSDLGHIYNWCAMMAPGVYPSLRLFEFAHVEKTDHWGAVLEWKNIESMNNNFNIISVDTDEEVELPPLIESVVPYTLTKQHLKLYKKVEASMLEDLPADMIDLAVRSMFSTLQRLVLLPREFGLDIDSPVLEFINGYLDQMDPEDGIVFYTRHVLVSQMLAESIPDSVAVYGKISKVKQQDALAQIKSGECKRLIGNMDSIGVGKNHQILNHQIDVELPFRWDKDTQVTGRIHRQGQTKTCFASYPLAKGTIQHQIYHKLLKNKEDLSQIKSKSQMAEFLA